MIFKNKNQLKKLNKNNKIININIKLQINQIIKLEKLLENIIN